MTESIRHTAIDIKDKTVEVASSAYAAVAQGVEKASEKAAEMTSAAIEGSKILIAKTAETAGVVKEKVVEVGSSVYNTVSEKAVEGYAATKDFVINASHVVAENASIAAEKVKEGTKSAYETVSGAV